MPLKFSSGERMTEFLEAVELWVEATLQAPERDVAVQSLTESFLREE